MIEWTFASFLAINDRSLYFEREIIYLFVHSVLHLLGYDHMDEDEKKIMRRQEEAVMEQLGITREEA